VAGSLSWRAPYVQMSLRVKPRRRVSLRKYCLSKTLVFYWINRAAKDFADRRIDVDVESPRVKSSWSVSCFAAGPGQDYYRSFGRLLAAVMSAEKIVCLSYGYFLR